MKKFLTMLMVASIFSLVACGPTEEEKAANEAEAAAMVEEMMGGLEEAMEEVAEEAAPVELAAHVCTDKCTEEACHTVCGEEGHECSDACHADEATEGEEEHVHAEGEEHSH
jgi:hypothetical protein